MERQYLLTEDILDNMQGNEFYGLFAEPGAGKTQTFKDVVAPWAVKNMKSVLFLCHRNSLKSQTYKDLQDFLDELLRDFKGNLIKIASYQAIEYAIDSVGHAEAYLYYDLIVCDEAHYFVTDSWNNQTHLSVEYLEEMNVPKILMTGTPKILRSYDKTWDMKVLREPDRTNTNVAEILFYSEKDTLVNDILSKHSDSHKILSFVKGKTEYVKNLAEKYGGSFICSKGNLLYDEYADKEVVTAVENNIRDLPSNLIFSTSIWNEGINIKDENLKMICSFFPASIDEFIQQVARARNSKVTVCLLMPSRKKLHAQRQQNLKELKSGNISNPRKHYLISINEEIEEILKVGYINYVMSYFPTVPYTDVNAKIKSEELDAFLESAVGIKMFKRNDLSQNFTTLLNKECCKKMAQEQFINRMVEDFGVRGNGRSKERVGMKVIQNWIDAHNIRYKLVNKRDRSRNSDTFQKSYWELIEIVNDFD